MAQDIHTVGRLYETYNNETFFSERDALWQRSCNEDRFWPFPNGLRTLRVFENAHLYPYQILLNSCKNLL